MGVVGAVLAMLLPAFFGALCVKTALRESGPGSWAVAIGYGYLFGFAVVAMGLAAQGAITGSLSPWVLLVALGVGSIALWLRLPVADRESAWPQGDGLSTLQALPPLVFLLLAWCMIRGLSLAYELFDQGLYGWDAWSTWAYRARVWVETGAWITFVSPDVWLAERQVGVATLIAPHYPRWVSLIAAWPSLAVGEWTEWAANLPWLGLWVALGCGIYGQARRWGASVTVAMVTVWLLLSVPLVGSQVALAGYADLWLAAALGFAFMSFLRWARDGDHRQGIAAAVCAVMAIFIKAEGLVWVLFFVPALAALYLGWRGWLTMAAMLVAAGVALHLSGGITLTLPGLGSTELSLDRVSTARTGVFEFISQEGVLQPLLTHLFVFGTWHLLAMGLVAALMISVGSYLREDRGLLAETWQRASFVWVCAATVAFYVLFFWTPAAEWVRLGTSGNRIMLHFTPALIFWCMTLWVRVSSRLAIEPASAA